jgi:putative Mg2+ transporter-C (MgtC) family protein
MEFDLDLDIDMLWRLLLAIVLGGVIGIEREWLNKSAGFRTMILICMGATIFTICSQHLGHLGDHSRIASNIVVGVGFIGGGVIFKGEVGVNGITTAACIWVTAGIGMLIGSMHWEIACIATGMVVIVLFLLKHVERLLDRLNSVREYQYTCTIPFYQTPAIETMVARYGLKLRTQKCKREADKIEQIISLQGKESNHTLFINEMMGLKEISRFEY